MPYLLPRWLCIGLLLAVAPLWAQRKTGNPLDHLPPNMEVLTHFGERADISPDNRRIAFMAKSFGDAFVLDLATRQIRCLTCNVPGAAFLRVMHLSNGDYLLIGPERFKDIRTSRHDDNEFWYLAAKPGAKPVRASQPLSEGAAISKRSMQVAWSITRSQDKTLPDGHSQLWMATFDPTLPGFRNKRLLHTSPSRDCILEAQDFYDQDRRLTYSCYQPKGNAAVFSIEIASGKITELTKLPGEYNEVEGIFPDGKFTLVESDHQAHEKGWEGGFRNIDLWKLPLDGTGAPYTRVTYFNDYEGWKASNPVVATDGSFLAFQIARSADEAGVGYGIVRMRLTESK